DKLRNDSEFYDYGSKNHWRDCKVADPNVPEPADLVKVLQEFDAISPDKLIQDRGTSSEDIFFRDFLPVACIYGPKNAIDKARSLIISLLTREGFPLRQLILTGREYSVLLNREFAL